MIIYVATPYTHHNGEIRQRRYEMACLARNHFIREGHVVFSPIASSHPAALDGVQPPQGWYEWDLEFLQSIKPEELKIAVIMLPGWAGSFGVELEMNWAETHGVDVEFYEFAIGTFELRRDWEMGRIRAMKRRSAEGSGE